MASSIAQYTVTITNSNAGALAPADGFVDNKKVEDYGVSLATTPGGLNYLLCQAKRRANVRYREIINQLSLVTNAYVDDLTISSDATHKAEASSFAFIVVVEHGDASLITADELVAKAFLTSTNCIKRCVARALIADMTGDIDVFDPTSANSFGVLGVAKSVPRTGCRIISLHTDNYASDIAAAEAMIAVTQKIF